MRLCILFILILLSSSSLFAEKYIRLQEPGRRAVGKSFRYLEDPSRLLVLSDLLRAEKSGKKIWSDSSKESFSFGFSVSAVWLTFDVKNTEAEPLKWYLETMIPIMDNIQLYVLDSEGNRKMLQTGNQFAVDTRSVYHRFYNFSFETPPQQTQRIFLRLYTTTSLNLMPYISLEDVYQEHLYAQIPVPGLYYGFLILMILYNFFLFARMRDLAYIYYSLYIFCILEMAANLNGHTQLYLWPDKGEFSMRSIPIIAPLASFSICHLVRHYVLVRNYSLGADRFLKYLANANLVFGVCTIFYLDMHVLNVVTSYVTFVSISMFMSVVLYMGIVKKSREARYFITAFSMFFVAALVYIIFLFSYLPLNFITLYGILIGSAFELVVISLGLADRFKNTRREMRKTDERYKRMIENTQDIIFSLDKNLRFVSVNSALYRHLVYLSEDLLGRPLTDLFFTESGKDSVPPNFNHIHKYLILSLKKNGFVSIRRELEAKYSPEPLDFNISLEFIRSKSGDHIFGKAVLLRNEIFLQLLKGEESSFTLSGTFNDAEKICELVTRNVRKFMDGVLVRRMRARLLEILMYGAVAGEMYHITYYLSPEAVRFRINQGPLLKELFQQDNTDTFFDGVGYDSASGELLLTKNFSPIL